jgi:glutathione S-transferase
LAPPLGSAERAHFYKWMAWLTNTPQAMLMHYFYPERLVDDGDSAAAQQIRSHAQAKVVAMLALLDAQLAGHGGPWLLGERYTAADPFAFMLSRWTRGFDERPARSFAHIAPFLQRMAVRPAVQRTFEAEGLALPWY